MDAPPPNYNPNESLLNGGTDAAIMKVMGGGGLGGDLNGYNETQSLLNGGLDAVIEKIEGGGIGDIKNIGLEEDEIQLKSAEEDSKKAMEEYNKTITNALGNVEVVDYKRVQSEPKDKDEFNALKTVITNYTNISALITRLKSNILNKKSKAVFRYINRNGILERTSLGGNIQDEQIIRYIPPDVKYMLVVPTITDAYDFFILIKFLIVGDLCSIDKRNNYVLKRGVYIIFLNIVFENQENDETLKYMYYKFVSTNMDQCMLITKEEKAILFINDNIIGFLSDNNDNFFKPETGTVDITEKDLIYEYGIKALKYVKTDLTYDGIKIIKPGDTDPNTTELNDYNTTLNKKSLIFKLKEVDIVYSKIDLYGKYYKIRVPRFADQSDSVYRAWSEGNKYEKDEEQLIKDLKLELLLEKFEIPKFLYYLSYYKCFDDVSLLTRQECKQMRSFLENIYTKIIENRDKQRDEYLID